LDVDAKEYDIHLNFPGGIPIDGPSAGIAIAAAVYSAIMDLPVNNDIAMTGELSIRGKVKPVGGVSEKVEAAKLAGINKVLIPRENWQETFENIGIEVIPIDDITEVISHTFHQGMVIQEDIPVQKPAVPVLAASPAIDKSF
jgi:Lon-like ATP-dependent protease